MQINIFGACPKFIVLLILVCLNVTWIVLEVNEVNGPNKHTQLLHTCVVVQQVNKKLKYSRTSIKLFQHQIPAA